MSITCCILSVSHSVDVQLKQVMGSVEELAHTRPQLGPHAHVRQAEDVGRVLGLALDQGLQHRLTCSRHRWGARYSKLTATQANSASKLSV